jgi:WD40 repeat protein
MRKWSPCVYVLEGDAECFSLEFSPDGKRLVSGSGNHTVQLWNVKSGARLQTMNGHSDRACSLAYSPDGMHIVSGSRDRGVKVWNTASGQPVREYTGHSDWVQCVAFSMDGLLVVSGDMQGNIHIWSRDAARSEPKVVTMPRPAISFTFARPDQFLVATYDGSIAVWELNSDGLVTCIERHDHHMGDVAAFTIASEKRLAVSLSHTGKTITVWDVQTWTENRTFKVSLPSNTTLKL